jgi:hypothetical protein
MAIVAAVLMIATAFFIRSRTNAKDEATQIEASKVTGTLVCATELRTTCEQLDATYPDLDVRVEDAGVTADTLSGSAFNRDTAKIDAWLAPKAYPAMVNDTRSRNSLDPALDDTSKVLGRSPAVIVGFRDRLAALAKECGVGDDQVDWKCVGSAAGRNWNDLGSQFGGTVKPGIQPPDRSAAGLMVLSQGTAEQVGRPDFASNDLDESTYQSWLSQLKRSINQPPSGSTPLDLMLTQGVSVYQVVGSLEALAGPAVNAAGNRDKLKVLYPANVTTADLVVVPVRGSDKGGRMKQLLESGAAAASLAKAGWRVDGQSSVDGVGNAALPDADGLPAAGALVALIESWKES